jgi:hypothetical protein
LNVEDETLARKKAKKARDQERATFFWVGFSSICGEPLHKELKRLRDKHNLKWLWTAMSYHKFSNLGEKFNSDLSGKITKGVYDLEWSDRACNCNSKTLLNDGHCLYESQCRKSMVVYNLECKLCDSHNVGKTQQYLKDRTNDRKLHIETLRTHSPQKKSQLYSIFQAKKSKI